MATEVELSDEEVALLDLLLTQEMESNRVELRHTAGQPYRDYLQQRMAQTEALAKKVNAVLGSC